MAATPVAVATGAGPGTVAVPGKRRVAPSRRTPVAGRTEDVDGYGFAVLCLDPEPIGIDGAGRGELNGTPREVVDDEFAPEQKRTAKPTQEGVGLGEVADGPLASVATDDAMADAWDGGDVHGGGSVGAGVP